MASIDTIAQQIEILSEVYNQRPTEAQIKIICKYLEPISDEHVERGVAELIKTRTRGGFPVLGEIYQAVLGARDSWEKGNAV